MEAVEHTGFNLASSVVVCNTLSALHLTYITGPALLWSTLRITDHLWTDTLLSEAFWHKAIFYIMVVWTASLPDIDQKDWFKQATGLHTHRGITHSCCGIITGVMIIGVFLALIVVILALRGWALPVWFVNDLTVALLSGAIGCVLHAIADGFTIQKVRYFYPDEDGVSLQLGKNESRTVHAVVWLLFFIVGALFALRFFGL